MTIKDNVDMLLFGLVCACVGTPLLYALAWAVTR